LPDIAKQFDSFPEKGGSQIPDIEKINQNMLKARNELDRYFGIAAMYDMNPDLRDLLISVSILAENKGNEDFPFKSGINSLAAALQKMYHGVILSADMLHVNIDSPSNIKPIAFGKAVRNKLVKSVQDIPPVISEVNSEKLTDILQGSSYSLQANFIVVLYLCENETLEAIYNKCPDLLTITAELAELRGHGNTDYSEEANALEKFKGLKEKAYMAIKTLMEV